MSNRSLAPAATALLLAAALATGSPPVTAAEPPAATATATPADTGRANRLFDLGFKLKTTGKLEEGCRWIQESFELRPGLGAHYHLADCRAKLGLRGRAALDVAELGARLAEVRARDPRRAGSLARIEADARALATELRGEIGTLPSLALQLASGLRRCRDLSVAVDGVVLDPARLSGSIPVDPGHHVVTARSGRRRVTEVEADVVAGSYALPLAAPEGDPCADGSSGSDATGSRGQGTSAADGATRPQVLVFVVPGAAGASGAGKGGQGVTGKATDVEPGATKTTGRDIGIGAALAVGTAGLALGLGYGVSFLVERDGYERDCPMGHAYCTDGRSSDRRYSDLVQLRTVETVALVTGAAGFAIAGVLWALPLVRGRPVTLAVAPPLGDGPAGFTVTGSF